MLLEFAFDTLQRAPARGAGGGAERPRQRRAHQDGRRAGGRPAASRSSRTAGPTTRCCSRFSNGLACRPPDGCPELSRARALTHSLNGVFVTGRPQSHGRPVFSATPGILFHRPRRIARPLAPRARVQPGARQSGDVRARAGCGTPSRRTRSSRRPRSARAPPRAAVSRSRRASGERNIPCSSTFCMKWSLTAPGMCPGDAVDRLDFAAIAFGRPRIDQPRRSASPTAVRPRPRPRPCPRAANRRTFARAGFRDRRPSADASAIHRANPPSSTATLVVAHPAKQPPQPAREHAVVLIVGDDLDAVGDAEPAKRPGERRRVRQRMAAVVPRQRAGEVATRGGHRRPPGYAVRRTRVLPSPHPST